MADHLPTERSKLNVMKFESVHRARLHQDTIVDVWASEIWSASFNQTLGKVFSFNNRKSKLGYSFIRDISNPPFTFTMMCSLQVKKYKIIS